MDTLTDVVEVEAREDNTLLITFENGERRRFNMGPYLSRKPFLRLQHRPLFLKAKVAYGTVVWPGNIDIDPETLWDRSEPVE